MCFQAKRIMFAGWREGGGVRTIRKGKTPKTIEPPQGTSHHKGFLILKVANRCKLKGGIPITIKPLQGISNHKGCIMLKLTNRCILKGGTPKRI